MTLRNRTADTASGRLVDIQTRFHRYSVHAGGVSRNSALDRAEEVITGARAELDKHVFGAFSALMEQAESGAPSALALREPARDLRDFGELAGFPMVTAIAAMLVDLLSGSVEGRMAYRADVVECYIDALKVFCADEKRGLSKLEFPDLLDELRDMQDRLLPETNRA